MADIDVVKKGSRAWVWVLMLVVLALILWFMLAGNNAPQTTGLIVDPAATFEQAFARVQLHWRS